MGGWRLHRKPPAERRVPAGGLPTSPAVGDDVGSVRRCRAVEPKMAWWQRLGSRSSFNGQITRTCRVFRPHQGSHRGRDGRGDTHAQLRQSRVVGQDGRGRRPRPSWPRSVRFPQRGVITKTSRPWVIDRTRRPAHGEDGGPWPGARTRAVGKSALLAAGALSQSVDKQNPSARLSPLPRGRLSQFARMLLTTAKTWSSLGMGRRRLGKHFRGVDCR